MDAIEGNGPPCPVKKREGVKKFTDGSFKLNGYIGENKNASRAKPSKQAPEA